MIEKNSILLDHEMRYLPSFRALRCFEAAVRTGTLSAAARELNITTGAVSRQISALEEQIGVTLMRRDRNGVAATAEGQAFADHLAIAFSSISEAIDKVAKAHNDTTLTLNVYPTFAIQWLMPRLGDFYAVASGVDLRIRPSLQEHPFERDDIDVAIMIGIPQDQSLYSRTLFQRRFTPVCSPATLQATGPVTPADLCRMRIFYSDRHIEQWKMWLKTAELEELDLPKIGIRFENSTLAYQAAREGVGFVIGQPMFLRADLESERLLAPFTQIVESDRPYSVMCRLRDVERPPVRLFVNWVAAAATMSESPVDSANLRP
jgi:LysR family transcriptional regulator, glycine cleavage system transcriptional activator